MDTKTCMNPQCECEWPATTEFWAECKTEPGGLWRYCKVCESDRLSIYYLNNRAAVLERKRQRYYAGKQTAATV